MGVSGQLHAAAALPPRERAPSTHWIRGCVGPRACLDVVVKRKFPIIQPVGQRYTTELSRLLFTTVREYRTKYSLC